MRCSANPPKAKIRFWSWSTPTLKRKIHSRFPNSELRIPNFEFDLLGQPLPKISAAEDKITFTLAAGRRVIASRRRRNRVGLSGDAYRRARAQAALRPGAELGICPIETIDGLPTGAGWPNRLTKRPPTISCSIAAGREFARAQSTIRISSDDRQVDRDCEIAAKISARRHLDLARPSPDHTRAARPLAVD